MDDGGDLRPGTMHDGRVASTLGRSTTPPVPGAVRSTTPGWRDPRLWVGILIVTVSVIAGARLLSSADDTVTVWAAAGDLGTGDTLTAADLVPARVRFASPDGLGDYFTTEDELPADLELTRVVGAGELLPRGAVGPAGGSDMLQVPLAVDAEQVPGSVHSGSVVDVYLVASSGGAGPGGGHDARSLSEAPALAAATVVDAPALDQGFAATGRRQLVLAVPEEAARRFFRLLGSVESPVVTVVRRG